MPTVTVVITKDPTRTLQAVQFFAGRPVVLGQPLRGSTMFRLSREELLKHRNELEPLVRDHILGIEDDDGKPWNYPNLTPSLPWLPGGVPQTARSAIVPNLEAVSLLPILPNEPEKMVKQPDLVQESAPVMSVLAQDIQEPATVLEVLTPVVLAPPIAPEVPELASLTEDVPDPDDAKIVDLEKLRADSLDLSDPQEQFLRHVHTAVEKRRPSRPKKVSG